MTLGGMKKFIKAVEKKYGTKKALALRIEVQHPESHGKEVFFIPQEVAYLGVAVYPKTEEDPEEKTVVIR